MARKITKVRTFAGIHPTANPYFYTWIHQNLQAMKKLFYLLAFLPLTAISYAQSGNPNTMSVLVDGELYETEPRRIRIGRYGYITGNVISPDKSLRIWMGTYDGEEITESGQYLIVGDENYKKDDAAIAAWSTGAYKGIAFVKYVEETKTPRMEYHVGESVFTGQAITAVMGDDGYLELTFDADLDGSYWKEKVAATAFGGVGRLTDKMKDKAVTGATGYDQDIDPEGRGYRRQKETDQIKLTEARIRLKME